MIHSVFYVVFECIVKTDSGLCIIIFKDIQVWSIKVFLVNFNNISSIMFNYLVVATSFIS